MRKILVAALMLPAFYGISQTENTNRFGIGLSVIPTLNDYRYVKDGSNTTDEIEPIINDVETGYVDIQGGADVFYRLGKRFSVFTGIHNRQVGVNIKLDEFYPFTTNDPSIPKKAVFKYRYQYFHVPLEVRFYAFKGLYAQAGAGFNFLYGHRHRGIYTYNDGRVDERTIELYGEERKKMVFSADFQMGYTFNRNGKFNYSAAAYSSIGLTNMFEEVPLNRKFYSVGIAMQVQYSM
jgi:hypothetical protein